MIRNLQTDITSVPNLVNRISRLINFRTDFENSVLAEKGLNKSVNRFFDINSCLIDFEMFDFGGNK